MVHILYFFWLTYGSNKISFPVSSGIRQIWINFHYNLTMEFLLSPRLLRIFMHKLISIENQVKQISKFVIFTWGVYYKNANWFWLFKSYNKVLLKEDIILKDNHQFFLRKVNFIQHQILSILCNICNNYLVTKVYLLTYFNLINWTRIHS